MSMSRPRSDLGTGSRPRPDLVVTKRPVTPSDRAADKSASAESRTEKSFSSHGGRSLSSLTSSSTAPDTRQSRVQRTVTAGSPAPSAVTGNG